jgi:hypothetical protein
MDIQLTKGFVTIVDDDDVEKLSKYKWHAHNTGKKIYAATNIKDGTLFLHRFLLTVPKGMLTDHINRDTLDNRKENLRIVTYQQNSFNSKSRTILPKGVCYDKQTGKYIAQIMLDGKNIKLGRFNKIEDASKAYNDKAEELFGGYYAI